MRKLPLITLFLCFVAGISYCGEMKISIYYLEGEHSKDSWSKETTISIDDRAYSYSVAGSGFHHAKNENKNGDFTKEQFEKIKSFVLDNNLLLSDSLFDKDEKYKSFERFTNIVITISLGSSQGLIKINGDVQNFENKTLYKNSTGLIDLVTGFIKGEN